jgi:hypothetical protein
MHAPAGRSPLIRNMRERPRVTTARMFGTVLLVSFGIAVGAGVDRSPERTGYPRPRAQVERSEPAGGQQVRRLRVELQGAERRSVGLARDNARLRLNLRRLRRTVRHEKPKR